MLEQYEAAMAKAREAFSTSSAIVALFDEPIDADTLEAFLIRFSAAGVAMTEPVAGWIKRAGQRCAQLGLEKLGRALEAHASQEDGHHLLMMRDAEHLVQRWNLTRGNRLDAHRLVAQEPSSGVLRYQKLHEDTIAGDAPFGQLAIEYEIERLSVVYGPRLLDICTGMLGPEILKGLTFLTDHVELDVAHTQFNEVQLHRLLTENPMFLEGLITAGSEALAAYSAFLGDCLSMAETLSTGAVA